MATNWIIETGQAWKLYLVLAGFLATLLCLTVAFFRLATGSGEFLSLTAGGFLLGCATFLWFTRSLRCPRCRARLVWKMVASRPHSSWLIDLAALDDCPICRRSLTGGGSHWSHKARTQPGKPPGPSPLR